MKPISSDRANVLLMALAAALAVQVPTSLAAISAPLVRAGAQVVVLLAAVGVAFWCSPERLARTVLRSLRPPGGRTSTVIIPSLPPLPLDDAPSSGARRACPACGSRLPAR